LVGERAWTAVRWAETTPHPGPREESMDTVMILGAGVYQLPAIERASRLGLRTVACSYLPGDPGLTRADKGFTISTTDREAVFEVAQAEGIAGILTGASDAAVPTVGYVNDRLGLSGVTLAQAVVFSRKDRFRRFLAGAGLPCPSFEVLSDAEAFLKICRGGRGRHVLKPVDCSGSRGVTAFELPGEGADQELRGVFDRAMACSTVGRVILEQFLSGVEHGGDAFFVEGRLRRCHITRKTHRGPPHYVPDGHRIPSGLDEPTERAVGDALTTTITKLGFTSGVVNFDVFVSEGGGVHILELSPRYGGNCIPTVIEAATGFDEISAALAVACGRSCEEQLAVPTDTQCCAASRIIGSDRDGVIERIGDLECLRAAYPDRLVELQMDVAQGAQVSRLVSGNLRLGHLVARADDVDELDRLMAKLESAIGLAVAPAPPVIQE